MYNPWVRSEWSWLMCTCTAGFYTFHLGQFCHWCWLWNEAELCFLEWGRIDFYMCNDLKTACYICFAFVVMVGVVRSSPGLLWNDLKCATALHDRCLQVVQCTHSFTQLIPARVVQCTHSFMQLIPARVVQCTHSFTLLIPARVVQCTHSFTLLIPARVVQCTHSFTQLIPARVVQCTHSFTQLIPACVVQCTHSFTQLIPARVVQCTHSFTQLIPARVVQCTHSFTQLIPTRVETWESVWWSVCLEACWQKVANTSASQFSWSVRLSGSLLTQSGKHFCVAIFMDINCVTNVSSATLFPLMPVQATVTLLWRCRGVEKASCIMFFSSRLHPAKFEFIMTDNYLHCGGEKKTSLAVSVIIVQGQW